MRSFRFTTFPVSLAALLLTGFGGGQSLWAEDEPLAVAVADTSTSVNIAKVYLSVGAMSVDDGQLVGTYSINVPLRQSKSEKGLITLPMEKELVAYLRHGGTLSGEGLSKENNPDGKRRIDARFSAFDSETKTGRIHLTIETSQRVLEFDSTYTLTGASPPATD